LFQKNESYSGVSALHLSEILHQTGLPGQILAREAGVGKETVRMLLERKRTFSPLDIADKLICACNRLGVLHGRLEEYLLVIPSDSKMAAQRMALDEWDARFDGIEPDDEWIARRALALQALRAAVIAGVGAAEVLLA
jgi:hypothetical protein